MLYTYIYIKFVLFPIVLWIHWIYYHVGSLQLLKNIEKIFKPPIDYVLGAILPWNFVSAVDQFQ
jgi:hypothetical protein